MAMKVLSLLVLSAKITGSELQSASDVFGALVEAAERKAPGPSAFSGLVAVSCLLHFALANAVLFVSVP